MSSTANSHQQQSALALLKASLYSPAAHSALCGSSPSPLANGTNFAIKIKPEASSVTYAHDACSDTSSNSGNNNNSNNVSANNDQNRSMDRSYNGLDRSDCGSTKDDSYMERRRKNNEAAKRSRDARRAKEDDIALRAALLERENLQLKVELTQLKEETHRLRCLLYNK